MFHCSLYMQCFHMIHYNSYSALWILMLKHQGISSNSADYAPMHSSCLWVKNNFNHNKLPRAESNLSNFTINHGYVELTMVILHAHGLVMFCFIVFITLRPRQNGRHFSYNMFKCIFLNENIWIPIEISLKFVPKGSINNNPALFQIMAWRRPGDKPLSELMMVSLPMHICVTRPQWVK